MNVSYEPYRFLYEKTDGERNTIFTLNKIAPRFSHKENKNYSEEEEVLSPTENENDDRNVGELEQRNGTKKILTFFYQK